MLVRRPIGRRSAGLLVGLVVTQAVVAGCGGSSPNAGWTPPPLASWASLAWSGPVSDSSLSAQSFLAQWQGGFVAASNSQNGLDLQISADGTHWNDVATGEPSFRDAWAWGLVAGQDRLTLFGSHADESLGRKSMAWTSSDGRGWQVSDLPDLDGLDLSGAVSGAGGYAARCKTEGGYDVLCTSPDGQHWRRESPEPDPKAWNAQVNWVAPIGSGFVAGGYIEFAGATDQFPAGLCMTSA